MNKEQVSIVAVLANVILALSKVTIGLISRSSAVFAEGIHSAIDIISSGFSFLGIREAKKPADKKHPYGHYKFEVLSGLLITIILFGTGLWIIYNSYLGFINPKLIELSFPAIGIMAFSAIVNEIMARIKMHHGKKEQSLSLIADGVHSRIDVVSSLAVFAGLLLIPLFPYSDPLLALIIGLYLIYESIGLGKEAMDSLLDVTAGEDIENKIKKIIQEENIEFSELKTQKKGSVITANIIIKLEKSLSVEEASKISSDLQMKLIKGISNLRYAAIQIISHDLENSYYQPRELISGIKIGRSFGWQRKGKFVEKIQEAKGFGPGGKCICVKCGYETEHKRGLPCSSMICPKCKSGMARG
ncbi:MAG: cation diffusion facilitator family transporter [archaeon]